MSCNNNIVLVLMRKVSRNFCLYFVCSTCAAQIAPMLVHAPTIAETLTPAAQQTQNFIVVLLDIKPAPQTTAVMLQEITQWPPLRLNHSGLR